MIAKDHGKNVLSSSCTVNIFILDVNDCKPEVNKQFVFEITKCNRYATIHKNLGKINATNEDFRLNGSVYFKISPNNNSPNSMKDLLQITSDGHLSIYGNFDRETTKTIHSEIVVYNSGTPLLSSVTT